MWKPSKTSNPRTPSVRMRSRNTKNEPVKKIIDTVEPVGSALLLPSHSSASNQEPKLITTQITTQQTCIVTPEQFANLQQGFTIPKITIQVEFSIDILCFLIGGYRNRVTLQRVPFDWSNFENLSKPTNGENIVLNEAENTFQIINGGILGTGSQILTAGSTLVPVSIATSGSNVTSQISGNQIEVNVPTVFQSLGNQPFNISVVNISGLNSDFKESGPAST